MVEVDRARPCTRIGRHIPILEPWAPIESRRGCSVEHPPALAYVGSQVVNDIYSAHGSYFIASSLPRWRASWRATLMALIQFCYVSPMERRYACSLDLSLVLGSQRNQDYFHNLLYVIDVADWAMIPLEQSSRGNHSQQCEYSRGR